MMLPFLDLRNTFSNRAKWTNDIIGKGISNSMTILEETITDVNLLSIADSHSEYVLTKKFTRREEGASSGADWLWCIGEPGSWFCILVQAKVVKSHNGSCPQLNYNQGKQCQLLKGYARKHGLLPLYCIYNHIPKGYSPPPKARPALSSIDSFEWACALLSPERVQKLVRAKRTKHLDLLTFGLPWVYLFDQVIKSGETRLGVAIANAYYSAAREVSDQALSPDSILFEEDENIIGDDALSLLKQDLPSFVRKMVLNRSKAPIAGLSIISSIPIEESLNFKSVPLIPAKPLDDNGLKVFKKLQLLKRR